MHFGLPELIVIVAVALVMAVPITAAVLLISTVSKLSRAQKQILARLDDIDRRLNSPR